ncbi:nif11-like leader peptide domain protein [Synechococcus sp. BIOS-E4-1]|uniref:Nif11-like leader peptide family natural product precursor n=1 Tax=Synechococcus sp. BIOS-E4-1 TaxID=1400864 RepID=UPI00164456FC|nr:Nif11-like leader peptide family natural product precursor [Synechococcus sp. BIOS-E4-1]QNI54979.1 nif11-like leader peptide domain protein [Synechococcus sp. BIOS-E4-1]
MTQSLQEKIKAADDIDAFIAIAKHAGFMISVDFLKKAQSELSDEELEATAGGGWNFPTTMSCDACKRC